MTDRGTGLDVTASHLAALGLGLKIMHTLAAVQINCNDQSTCVELRFSRHS